MEWLQTDDAAFTEPFFEQTLRRLARLPANAPGLRRVTPAAALCDVPAGLPLAALVFHVSRCGSTLLAQMLAALPQHLVVAEAPVVDDILRATRGDPHVTDEDRLAWLRGALAALGQPRRRTERRLFVKLDCWSIFDLPLLARAFPEAPRIFLHRHPLEVLVSLRRQPSLTLVRDTIAPAQLGLSAGAREQLSPIEHAAAILGAFYRAALARRREIVPVPYERVVHFACDALPGCAFDAGERARMLAVAARDAKEPARHFVADAPAKRAAADPALRAASERFAMPAYRAFLATAA